VSKLVGDFLEDVAVDLGDPNFDLWSKGDLLGFLVDGLGEMILYTPDQFTNNVDVVLVDGAQQSMPANAVDLVTPVCNLAAGIPTRAIRPVSLMALDRAAPSWRSETPSATTKGVAYDRANGGVFYVTPPAIAGNTIRLGLLVQPVDLEFHEDVPVDETYFGALKNYIYFRAFSRDDDHAAQNVRAMSHLEAFKIAIGAAGGESQ
jgi:hypothetical protein